MRNLERDLEETSSENRQLRSELATALKSNDELRKELGELRSQLKQVTDKNYCLNWRLESEKRSGLGNPDMSIRSFFLALMEQGERLANSRRLEAETGSKLEPKVNLDETTEEEPVRLVNMSKTTQQNI